MDISRYFDIVVFQLIIMAGILKKAHSVDFMKSHGSQFIALFSQPGFQIKLCSNLLFTTINVDLWIAKYCVFLCKREKNTHKNIDWFIIFNVFLCWMCGWCSEWNLSSFCLMKTPLLKSEMWNFKKNIYQTQTFIECLRKWWKKIKYSIDCVYFFWRKWNR